MAQPYYELQLCPVTNMCESLALNYAETFLFYDSSNAMTDLQQFGLFLQQHSAIIATTAAAVITNMRGKTISIVKSVRKNESKPLYLFMCADLHVYTLYCKSAS